MEKEKEITEIEIRVFRKDGSCYDIPVMVTPDLDLKQLNERWRSWDCMVDKVELAL